MSEPYDAYFVFDNKSKLDKALKVIKTNSKLIYPAHGIYSFIFKKTVGLAKELKSLYGRDAESFGEGCAPGKLCVGSFTLNTVDVAKLDSKQKKQYETYGINSNKFTVDIAKRNLWQKERYKAYGIGSNKFILEIHFIDSLFCLMILDAISYKTVPDFFKTFCEKYSVERAFLTYEYDITKEVYNKA